MMCSADRAKGTLLRADENQLDHETTIRPLLAAGLAVAEAGCLLLGEERTRAGRYSTSAFDPLRNSTRIGNVAHVVLAVARSDGEWVMHVLVKVCACSSTLKARSW
jgi:hypothetical protein